MKLFRKLKDGGPESNVTGYFLVEIKWLFSIVLLRFAPGSREAYHTHAFNALSLIVDAGLYEYVKGRPMENRWLYPGWNWTARNRFHRVYNDTRDNVWALSLRGPWIDNWKEYLPATEQEITLTHGRKVVPE